MEKNAQKEYIVRIGKCVNALNENELEELTNYATRISEASPSPILRTLFDNVRKYGVDKILEKRNAVDKFKDMPKFKKKPKEKELCR